MTGPQAGALADLEDIRRFEGITHRNRYPHDNSYDLLKQSCRKFGNDKALTFLPTGVVDDIAFDFTFLQMFERITQTANMLTDLEVGVEDVVTILLPMLPETHYALWGASAAGIASPINPFLEAEHIAEIINATGSKVLMTLAPGQDTRLWEKVTVVMKNTPALKAIVLISCPGFTLSELPEPPRDGLSMVDFNQHIDTQTNDQLISGRTFSATDIAMYLHTGGTTSRPKVAQLSHENMVFMAQLYVDMTSQKERFSCLSGLPLFHVFGIIATSLAAMSAGRHLVLMTPSGFRNPEVIKNFWHHIARFCCTAFATVPTVLSSLLAVPVGDNDIACLQEVSTGGAPLPHQLRQNFEKHFNVIVLNGYGMTESSMMLARASPQYPPPPGSVGFRVPYVKLITALIEDDRIIRECSAGEPGIVLCQGPNIFCGYLNPKDNQGAWIDHNWFNTGDLGYFDESGHLFLTGRAKDLIIRGGHNIDPALIEKPLEDHPAVAQVVAIGQPDPYAGEIPVAFVTLESDQTVTVEELLEYCRDTIGERAAVPKRIEIIDEMPLTAVAKFYKPALREWATDFAISTTLKDSGIQASISTKVDQQRGLVVSVALASGACREQAGLLLQGYPLIIEFV